MGEITTESGETGKKTTVAAAANEVKSYRTVLSDSSGTLTDCLLPTVDLLTYLHQQSVLSQAMVDKVLCRPSRADRVRVLLKFLMNLGPESVDRLVEGLRLTDQGFLANILAAQPYT